MDWDLCKDDFQPNDGLRDIYVLQASLEDWNLLLPLFHSCEHKFSVAGETSTLPTSLDTEFFDSDYGKLLSLFVEGMQINCHFFVVEEIELDIDPRDIVDESKLTVVLEIMRKIAQTLHKDVLLTPENCWHIPIFVYDAASDQVKYCPA